eukprot:822732-Pyramimonas_sp.AAC.1
MDGVRRELEELLAEQVADASASFKAPAEKVAAHAQAKFMEHVAPTTLKLTARQEATENDIAD